MSKSKKLVKNPKVKKTPAQEPKTTASITQCVYPQVGCLVKAEDILGENRTWTPSNAKQFQFLKEIFGACRKEVGGLNELESIANYYVEVVNKFLKDKGFDIQLDPMIPPSFAVASVLDVLVKWKVEGKLVKLSSTVSGKEFDAAKMDKTTVFFMSAAGHNSPIAVMETETEHKVMMTLLDKEPKQLDLLKIASDLSGKMHHYMSEHEGLIFPCVDLDQKVDISWFIGMSTQDKGGQEWVIAQALQQTILRMNHKGARAKSGVGMGMRCVSLPIQRPPFVIDRPFLVWFEKPGLSHPLISCFVKEEDWKLPKEL